MENHRPVHGSLREHMLLFREFVRFPFHTGALAPSSDRLAQKMVASLSLSTAKTVVELGPGTGALTSALLPQLNPETRFLAVELNPTFAKEWSRQFPGRQVEVGNVANLGEICRRNDIPSIDCIISGLPWASFPIELQEAGLNQIHSMLSPGGQMVTFGYQVSMCMPNGRYFRKLADRRFRSAEVLDWEWRNLPPAYVLRCTR